MINGHTWAFALYKCPIVRLVAKVIIIIINLISSGANLFDWWDLKSGSDIYFLWICFLQISKKFVISSLHKSSQNTLGVRDWTYIIYIGTNI